MKTVFLQLINSMSVGGRCSHQGWPRSATGGIGLTATGGIDLTATGGVGLTATGVGLTATGVGLTASSWVVAADGTEPVTPVVLQHPLSSKASLVVLALALLLSLPSFAAVDFRALRERYEKELIEDVVPFWEQHSLDREYGGFLTCLTRDGKPYDTFKQMWMQWREVWMFAALYNSPYRQPRWLKIAEDGFDFLYRHGRQPDGSYAYMLDRQGKVTALAGDDGSEVFNESFAAVACAELYLATRQEKYRQEAQSAYSAYRGKTAAAEAAAPKFPAKVVYRQLAYPMIALNVLTVMNRAFGGLDGEIEKCIASIRSFADQKTGLIHERRLPDGAFDHDTQDGRFINPGHTLEGLSFILARLRERPDAELLDFALAKTQTMGTFGWDAAQGGVWYFRDERDLPLKRNDAPLKAWWPQAEAMTAMLRAYEFSHDQWYLDYFLQVDRYVTDHLRDPNGGEWFAYKTVDVRQFHSYKGSRYKGFFHIPRFLLDSIAVLKRLEKDPLAQTPSEKAWHVTGGTKVFRDFLATLLPAGTQLKVHPSLAALPFDQATTNAVFFLLPDYVRGEMVLKEPDFEQLPRIKTAMKRGAGFYFENYVTPEYSLDGRHSDLTGLQILGRPRHLFQEYVVWHDRPLQARDGFYLPTTCRRGEPTATVRNCVGTHRVSVKGTTYSHVLTQGLTDRVRTAAFDLSRFDPRFRRPRSEWRGLLAETLAAPTGLSTNLIARAFDTFAPYVEPFSTTHGKDVDAAVKRAVAANGRGTPVRDANGGGGTQVRQCRMGAGWSHAGRFPAAARSADGCGFLPLVRWLRTGLVFGFVALGTGDD